MSTTGSSWLSKLRESKKLSMIDYSDSSRSAVYLSTEKMIPKAAAINPFSVSGGK